MDINNLNDLIITKLQVLHSTESQIAEALPLQISKASDEQIKTDLSDHLEQTKEQLFRLEDVANRLNATLSTGDDPVMRTLINTGQEMMQKTSDPGLIDMMIIGEAAKIEHYEISAYRGLITLLKKVDKNDLADKLKESLDEEESTANKLEMFASGGFGKIVAKLM